MNNNCGVYVHVPFCAAKCVYCDFLSSSEQLNQSAYVNALVSELAAAIGEAETSGFPFNINTVYIGGGTPTVLPPHLLSKVLASVNALPLEKDAEFTVEANPGTLDREKLGLLNAYGVNRLSIGLQTTQKHLLAALGRIHTFECFKENYYDARNAGFHNINIDLMFALPGQTLRMWQDNLDAVISLNPEHISAYSLTPSPGTPLWDLIESGETTLPGDECDREMYHYARKSLAEAGYRHYEISNFAKPGFESRHNINCWRMIPYYGFGLGAHSFDGRSRRWNTEDFAEYICKHTANPMSNTKSKTASPEEDSLTTGQLSEQDLLAESMILGLRLLDGMHTGGIAPGCTVPPVKYFSAQVEKLTARGLLEHSGNRVRLTPLGLDLANTVFSEFLV